MRHWAKCVVSGTATMGTRNCESVRQADCAETLDCCGDLLVQECRFTRVGGAQRCSPADYYYYYYYYKKMRLSRADTHPSFVVCLDMECIESAWQQAGHGTLRVVASVDVAWATRVTVHGDQVLQHRRSSVILRVLCHRQDNWQASTQLYHHQLLVSTHDWLTDWVKRLTSHSTQHRSFRRQSSRTILD